jgi:hypothetical protein
MSSTRKAKDNSVFRQERYASSQEYERGLSAYLVAKRTDILNDAADRELIWFLQHLSHQAGGLEAVAKKLISSFPDRIQTADMIRLGVKRGMTCSADQVRSIRNAFNRDAFLLKGENEYLDIIARRAGEDCDLQEKSNSYPTSYPAQAFFDVLQEEAHTELPNHLRDLCLDPSLPLKSGPWFFPGLITTLREYLASYIQAKGAGTVTTSLGVKACEVLDYTFFSRGLTLMEGEARRGKSFAARQWCAQRPGQARFVEVPTGNDEVSFFRELARCLGIGNFLQYKVTEIRARVESVLLTGQLMIVLDEGHRLWPHRNLRYACPSRINWVMAMANHGVPICCISTPQFIEMQKVVETQGNWNGAQLTGRISHYELLPSELTVEDLQAVAQVVLPEASASVLRALAAYARTSDRYLAAIDSISKRARYIAARASRTEATSEDVRIAMKESVIPADTRLHVALEAGRKAKAGHRLPIAPAQSVLTPARPENMEGSEASAPIEQVGGRSGINRRPGGFTGHESSDSDRTAGTRIEALLTPH